MSGRKGGFRGDGPLEIEEEEKKSGRKGWFRGNAPLEIEVEEK